MSVETLLDANERERVVALGGLHILATERHEARRIDNQLRGRAGRQGDPGSSRFYLSLQDDLMRIFGSERISGLMLKLGMEEGIPIEHGMVTRSIERAQRQVEAQNFGVRKHLLEYDDVMNKQRKAVYDMRRMVLEGKDTREHVLRLVEKSSSGTSTTTARRRTARRTGTSRACRARSRRPSASTRRWPSCGRWAGRRWPESSAARIRDRYDEKERRIGRERMLFHQRMIMLQIVDTQWKDHLYSLDHLKEGIGLRGYGQRDPLVEYKKESFQMFQALMDRIDEEILRWIFLYQPVAAPGACAGGAAPRAGGATRALAVTRAACASPSWPWRASRRAAQPHLQRPVRGLSRRSPRRLSRARRRAEPTRCRRSGARARRSAATIPAPAGAGRSTRSATGARA